MQLFDYAQSDNVYLSVTMNCDRLNEKISLLYLLLSVILSVVEGQRLDLICKLFDSAQSDNKYLSVIMDCDSLNGKNLFFILSIFCHPERRRRMGESALRLTLCNSSTTLRVTMSISA